MLALQISSVSIAVLVCSVDALLLDPEHPQKDMKPELKTWCQQHHAECLAQLALFPPGREALLQRIGPWISR